LIQNDVGDPRVTNKFFFQKIFRDPASQCRSPIRERHIAPALSLVKTASSCGFN